VAAGAAAKASDLGGRVVTDAYDALRDLIVRKLGKSGAVQSVEDEPHSELAKAALADSLTKASLTADPELAQHAEALRTAINDAARTGGATIEMGDILGKANVLMNNLAANGQIKVRNIQSFSGDNSGVVSNGDNNTIHIQRDPRQWGLNQDQAERFRSSLEASGIAGTIYIRINDTLSRNFRNQLINLIGFVPGWSTLDQGERGQNEIHGVIIYVRDASTPSHLGRAVIEAFKASGFSPVPMLGSLPSWTDNDVRIEIGSPP
jgi:hypothetical protein